MLTLWCWQAEELRGQRPLDPGQPTPLPSSAAPSWRPLAGGDFPSLMTVASRPFLLLRAALC